MRCPWCWPVRDVILWLNQIIIIVLSLFNLVSMYGFTIKGRWATKRASWAKHLWILDKELYRSYFMVIRSEVGRLSGKCLFKWREARHIISLKRCTLNTDIQLTMKELSAFLGFRLWAYLFHLVQSNVWSKQTEPVTRSSSKNIPFNPRLYAT